MRLRFGARRGAVVREVQERAAERIGVVWQLTGHRLPDRTRSLCEVRVLPAIAESSRNATDGGINRQHGMVRGEKQHPVGAALPHLRQAL